MSQISGNPVRITADVLLHTGPATIWAVQLEGGTDASSLDFHDAVTLAGTAIYGVTASATVATTSGQATTFIDLTNVGGIKFGTGCYCDWTGTAAVGYVWISPA